MLQGDAGMAKAANLARHRVLSGEDARRESGAR
jgi:hypothetical protein